MNDDCYFDDRYLDDWQDAGRADAAPVHCPLEPAPLPPLVGGFGLANDTDTAAPSASTMVANVTAILLLMSLPPG